MLRRSIDNAKGLLNWVKILFPRSSMKFFPPQFILRDPVAEGVKAAFKENHASAVIVFNMKNVRERTDVTPKYMNTLKKNFQLSIKKAMRIEDTIALHDYSSEGMTLIVKIHSDRHGISEIDEMIEAIVAEVDTSLKQDGIISTTGNRNRIHVYRK